MCHSMAVCDANKRSVGVALLQLLTAINVDTITLISYGEFTPFPSKSPPKNVYPCKYWSRLSGKIPNAKVWIRTQDCVQRKSSRSSAVRDDARYYILEAQAAHGIRKQPCSVYLTEPNSQHASPHAPASMIACLHFYFETRQSYVGYAVQLVRKKISPTAYRLGFDSGYLTVDDISHDWVFLTVLNPQVNQLGFYQLPPENVEFVSQDSWAPWHIIRSTYDATTIIPPLKGL